MSTLLHAILTGDIQQVRTVARTQPDLLAVTTFDGRLPLELAYRIGRSSSIVALLRERAPGVIPVTADDLLSAYLRELSQTWACAGWLADIEYVVWGRLQGDRLGNDTTLPPELDPEVLDDMRYLAHQCNGWVQYADNGPVFTSLSQWHAQYQAWKHSHV